MSASAGSSPAVADGASALHPRTGRGRLRPCIEMERRNRARAGAIAAGFMVGPGRNFRCLVTQPDLRDFSWSRPPSGWVKSTGALAATRVETQGTRAGWWKRGVLRRGCGENNGRVWQIFAWLGFQPRKALRRQIGRNRALGKNDKRWQGL